MARERIGEAAVRLSYNVGARMLGILGLKELVRRHALPRIVGVLQSAETPGSFAAADRYIEEEIERVVRKPGPIIVGPFLSEVGFSCFIGFRCSAGSRTNGRSMRSVSSSCLAAARRCGTTSLCGRYMDVFELDQFPRLRDSEPDAVAF